MSTNLSTSPTLPEVGEPQDQDTLHTARRWICGAHGIPECRQDDCPDLPWPEPHAHPMLDAFTEWARAALLCVAHPRDEEAFRAYSAGDRPLRAFLEATGRPQ